jgi:hypothetical protein
MELDTNRIDALVLVERDVARIGRDVWGALY